MECVCKHIYSASKHFPFTKGRCGLNGAQSEVNWCETVMSNMFVCSVGNKFIEATFVACTVFSGFDCLQIKPVLMKGGMNEIKLST